MEKPEIGVTPRFIGSIEQCRRGLVTGWLVDRQSHEPPPVTLCIDGFRLLSARADIHRSDIEAHHGVGRAGFWIQIAPSVWGMLPEGKSFTVLDPEGRTLPHAAGVSLVATDTGCADLERIKAEFASGKLISLKDGKFFTPLGIRAEWKQEIFRAYRVCRAIFQELTGAELAIAYGTLLGALRERDFVKTDDDFDVMFVLNTETTAEATARFDDVVRSLKLHGQDIHVVRSGQFHWKPPKLPGLDVFMGWYHGESFFTYNAGRRDPERRFTIHETIEFLGNQVVAPRHATDMLEAIYGADWSTPDPLFQWRVRDEVRSAMQELEDSYRRLTAAVG